MRRPTGLATRIIMSNAWRDPEVPARSATINRLKHYGAVLGPPAQKGVPSYKVVVEGDDIEVEV
jgi:hypothetical protein